MAYGLLQLKASPWIDKETAGGEWGDNRWVRARRFEPHDIFVGRELQDGSTSRRAAALACIAPPSWLADGVG